MRVLALFVLAAFTLGAAELPPPCEYAAAKTDNAPTIDGKGDDECWASAPWTEEFCDITGDEAKKPVYRTRAKMAWDDDYLYVFAELEEPNVTWSLTNRDDIVWHDNDFEIFVDPDGDGENYFEFEFNAANTLFDLFLTRPYSSPNGTHVMHQWNAEGLKSATARTKDGWTLEVALPSSALANGFKRPIEANAVLRVGFSRVEWLKREQEENWTWGPTGKVDMHMPHRWGKVRLVRPKTFVWYGWNRASVDESELLKRFRAWAANGVTGVCIGAGDDLSAHDVASRLAHQCGLEYHAWVTMMLKGDAPRSWYAVNKLGESAADRENRPYVEYYAVLDPHKSEVVEYLREKCAAIASFEAVDYVQLDYIRYADVILAEGLWAKYAEKTAHDWKRGEYPKADYCYCDECLKDYASKSNTVSWARFREKTLTKCVNAVAEAVHAKSKKVSADVFPDDRAAKMVRQDWANWEVDAFFAMNYNDFYLQGVDWIGERVRGERTAARERALYSGLKVVRRYRERENITDPEGLGLSPDELREAKKLSLAAGADGIAIFSADEITAEHWDAL